MGTRSSRITEPREHQYMFGGLRNSKTDDTTKAFIELNTIIRNQRLPPDEKVRKIERFLKRSRLTKKSFLRCVSLSYPPVVAIERNFQRNIVDLLSSFGFKFPDPDIRSTRYVLNSLCKKNEPDLSVIKSLVEDYGVDVNETDRASVSLFTAVQNGHLEIVKYLVEKGAWLNESNAYFQSILHVGEINTPSEIYEFLVSHGANVNATDNFGNTPLHFAAKKHCDGLMYILLKSGADVNARNVKGESALLVAANQYREAVSVPKRRSNYLNKCNEDWRTACTHVILTLLDAGFTPDERDFSMIEKVEGLTGENRNLIESLCSNVRPLQELCVFKIRDILSKNLPTSVDCLPLPSKLKDSVKLHHLPKNWSNIYNNIEKYHPGVPRDFVCCCCQRDS